MLAEEFIVIDPASPLWNTVRPLLEAALRLEQQDEDHTAWHGWRKPTIEAFLRALPDHCTLLVGVWDGETGAGVPERDVLVAGFVCEVRAGEVCTLRTLEALWTLAEADLPPLQELEPGYQHALALIRATRIHLAPVAWALFTDRATWNEWIYTQDEQEDVVEKGALLSDLAQQGRCVLLGSQTSSHQHHHPSR